VQGIPVLHKPVDGNRLAEALADLVGPVAGNQEASRRR
jgi:hypothetical protein